MTAAIAAPTAELVALKRRKLELLRERQTLVKSYGLLNYRPFPKQDAFHRAGHFKNRLVMSGNRFGKSTMGCAEDCAWLMGERKWLPKGDPGRTAGIPARPVTGLVITVDWDKVDEIWTSQRGDRPGKLWQLLPPDFVKSKRRNHSGAIWEVECWNGSVLRFDTVKSWKADPMAVESSDYDFVHVDEPCPEKMFKGAARGLIDRGGSCWFTLTPLAELWILDKFFPRKFNTRNLPHSYEQSNTWAIRGSTHDNPYISEAGRFDYEATLTPEEKECRIEGIPLELAGLVYKAFDWSRHVLQSVPGGWDSFSSPPKEWPVYTAFDVHPQTAQAGLLCAVSPLGQKFFFDEFFRVAKISDLCDWHKARLKDRYNVFSICDPSAWIRNPVTDQTIEQEFFSNGIIVEKGTKALSHGIIHAQGELAKADNIYFSPLLDETLFEIQRYCWDEGENKPVDKDDHMMENMYRLLLEDLKYVELEKFASRNRPVSDLVIDKADLNYDSEFLYLSRS